MELPSLTSASAQQATPERRPANQPGAVGGWGGAGFRWLLGLCAASVPLLVVLIVAVLWVQSRPSLHAFGWHFLLDRTWNPVEGSFGAWPFMYGTLVSSAVGLVIAVPLAVGVALFATELCPRALRGTIGFLVELLAAIPSVVYGLWGIFVLAPLLRTAVEPWLARYLGWTGLFTGPAYGLGMLAAGVILAIMILPIIAAISRDVLQAVPRTQREAALALGATRWEMIRLGALRNARSGILGAVILGLGRALGETMAVTMVIGNAPQIVSSLFAPGYTLASVIANEFTEATGALYLSALAEIGLVLFLITLIVNILARLLVWSATRSGTAKAYA